MNSKITFPELIELVAQATNTSKRMSELFLKELFATISQTLIEGENVRIKDLGQFKVEEVKPRRSVSVNTGREVEIPSHRRLVFTPAKTLAEAVNEPFAHFETVVLDDAVTDEQLQALDIAATEQSEAEEAKTEEVVPAADTTDNAPVIEPESTTPAEAEAKAVAEGEDKTEEPVEGDSESTTETITPPPFMPLKQEQPAIGEEELAQEIVDGNEEDPAQETVATIEKEPDTTQETTQVETEVPAQEGAEDVVEEKHEDEQTVTDSAQKQESVQEQEPQQEHTGRKHRGYVLTISEMEQMKRDIARRSTLRGALYGALGMLLIVLLGWCGYSYATGERVVEQADTVAVSDKDEMSTTEQVMRQTIAPADTTTAVAEVKVEEKPVAATPKVVTDTVTKTMFLTRMAKKHYGNRDFWVYIYEENQSKLDNPNHITPGTVVVIPPADKYGIDPKNPESLKKARKKQSLLFAKYAR